MVGAAMPHRPLLSAIYHVVPVGFGRVQIGNASRAFVVSGLAPTERLVAVLRALDGTRTVDELRADFPDLVPNVLAGLLKLGLLVEGDADLLRADPSDEAHLDELVGGLPAAALGDRLRDRTVVIAGCGPVGSSVALHLAKADVGNLVLVDVEPLSVDEAIASPVFRRTDVGRPRADVTRDLCRDAGGTCPSDLPNVSPAVLSAADVVVVEARYEPDGILGPVADDALASRIPYLLHRQDGLEAVIGPLVGPGGEPCHRCLETRRIGHVTHVEEHRAYLRHRSEVAPGSDVRLAAHAAVVSGLIATEVLRHLVGSTPRIADGALVIDLASSDVRLEPVLAVPECLGCATAVSHEVLAQ